MRSSQCQCTCICAGSFESGEAEELGNVSVHATVEGEIRG